MRQITSRTVTRNHSKSTDLKSVNIVNEEPLATKFGQCSSKQNKELTSNLAPEIPNDMENCHSTDSGRKSGIYMEMVKIRSNLTADQNTALGIMRGKRIHLRATRNSEANHGLQSVQYGLKPLLFLSFSTINCKEDHSVQTC